jgi:hypothetical protein
MQFKCCDYYYNYIHYESAHSLIVKSFSIDAEAMMFLVGCAYREWTISERNKVRITPLTAIANTTSVKGNARSGDMKI